MSKVINLDQLKEALTGVPSIRFALLFGSARTGRLLKDDSDVDVAVYLDHEPNLDERAHLLGVVQDAVCHDRVDLVFLNLTDDVLLQRETLKGRVLICRDPDAYADFFSLTDRQGSDEEARIERAWAMRRELASKKAEVEAKAQ